jgi:WS/DGAT/MGAT family acyltransferase
MQDWSLSPLDISFLAIESAETPMNLGAVVVLDGGPAHEVVLSHVAERLSALPRMRRRLRAEWLPLGSASWAEDPDFDVGRHIVRHETRGQGGRDELGAWVGRMLVERLDRSRPLWELHVLLGLADGGVAMLLKIHHAFADGISAGAVLYALADEGSGAGVPTPGEEPDDRFLAAHRPVARRLLGPLTGLTDPSAFALTAKRSLATAAGVVQSRSRPASGLPFDTVVGPQRAFAMASVDMLDVRAVRKVHGGMANDVLVALVAGALRSWLDAHKHDPDQVSLRAMIPVAGRRKAPVGGSGNNFSAFLIDLPVSEPDPVRRLQSVRADMERNKDLGPEGRAGAVAGLTNLLPPALVRLGGPLMAGQAARLFDVLVTAVPIGRPMRLAGAEVREIYPIAPLAQGQPLGVALSTYRGRGYVGITADPVVVPSPQELASAVPEALKELMAVSGVDPAGI